MTYSISYSSSDHPDTTAASIDAARAIIATAYGRDLSEVGLDDRSSSDHSVEEYHAWLAGCGDTRPPVATIYADHTGTGTAYHTLTAIASLVEAGLQPAGRATATATTLREMASIGDRLPLTLDDARAGYAALGVSQAADPSGPVVSRRSTCREIAALIQIEIINRGHAYMLGQPHRLGDVLAAVAERYAGAARQAAICETSKREALELAAGAQPMTMSPDEAAALGAEPAPPQARNTMGGGESIDEMLQRAHDQAATRGEPSE